MNDAELRELIEKWEFTGPEAANVFRLCQEVERRTRQTYYQMIQKANNAAESRVITPRDLDRFVWEKETERSG